jgi:ribonuclease E
VSRPAARSGRRGASKSGVRAALDEVPAPANEGDDVEVVDEAGDAPEEVPVKRTRTRTRSRKRPEPAELPVVPEAEEDADVVEVEEEEIFPPTAAVPSVTFQPPMVVFQPPVAPTTVETRPAPVQAADEDEVSDEEEADDGDESGRTSRRRRRRGGRGRGKAVKETQDEEPGEPAAEQEEAPSAEAEPADAETDGDEESDAEGDGQTGSSRRRRRRRRRSGSAAEDLDQDLPPNTVVHVRSARSDDRAPEDEVQSVRGSTRLEAKKQRRREGREQGRRRPPIITESEFLARRESVERVMVIRSVGDRTQIAVLEDGVLVEHHVDRASHQSYVGNVYLGKVQNVLPSMEAAFVDVGKGRNAVLYAGEVNWDVAGLEGQPRRIESALKSGQSVLVQVTKDPVGHKGARLTSQISLPGRYLVYVPDGSMTGISRKLPDKERARLKSILKKVMPENAGVIVRTAAEGASEEELSQDVSRLAAQWEHIKTQSKSASAPSLLHGEPDLTIRVVRDIFNEDFTKLVVAGADAWDTVEEYVDYVAPHLAERVTKWKEGTDVFEAYRIDEQLAKALERKVWLPSGGSLVIDRTEAMTVIDVNTGKFTGQGGNLEETVTRNNLEAAEEIVRQLRLRDVGGIIVVDFIDMVLESNRDLVLRRLLECLSRDRTKHQVAEVTSLGLVQMTRKRVGTGLLEAFSEPCECCNGRGIHVTLHPEDAKEPSAEEKSETGGRRRKRKGEVERAVESKLARQEAAKAAEAAKIAEVAKATVAQQDAPEAGAPAEAEEAPVKPKRTTRRARVTKPAGPPPEDEGQDSVLVIPSASETSASETFASETSASEISASRTSSSGASASGASGEIAESGGAETPTEAAVAAVEAVEEPPAAARTRARRTRRTTRAKAEVGADEAVGEA